MRRLLDSIRGGRGRNPSIDHPAPPLLPADRPRPITPKSPQSPQSSLGSLARLPPELRRRVLLEAFGQRTLHLDLRLYPRDLPRHAPPDGRYEHGCGSAPLRLSIPAVGPHDDCEWRWYSCVCHRLTPPGSYIGRQHWWPHRDDCLHGTRMATLCQIWPPPPDTSLSICDPAIGALGWLRTSRQAYLEGLDVLYGSNSFFIESRDLLDLLLLLPNHDNDAPARHVLLPQHLAMIKSLELRIDFRLFRRPQTPGQHENEPDEHKKMFLPHLARLATTFPRLRSLVISFTDGLYNDSSARPSSRFSEIEDLLLQPLVRALRPLASRQKQPVVVELPSNVFKDLFDLKKFVEETREGKWADGRGIWLRYPSSSTPPETSPCRDREWFYYMKEGVESDVYWDWQGRPRSRMTYMPGQLLIE